MSSGQPSLDQLRIFLAVVEEGSFNRAAKKLGRAISAISYGISNLEAQLDLRLFDREGSRRPKLTQEGAALVSDARAVADDVDALMAKALSLRQGLEPELSIAVDVMVPGGLLAQLLRDFQAKYPTVPMRLRVEALGAVAALVLNGRATFCIAGPEIIDLPELDRQSVGSVTLVPVSAPSHPLARSRKIAPGEARKHLQLVLTDRSPLTKGKEFSVIGNHSWRLADLGSKHALLKEGIGWGNMPLHTVEQDLKAGRLERLDLPEQGDISYDLYALWRKDAPPGPAAYWLLDAFQDRLSDAR